MTGPSSGSSSMTTVGADRLSALACAADVRSPGAPERIRYRRENGNPTTRTTAAAVSATGVVARSATAPQNALPIAMPAWNVIWYVPSRRAWTHDGAETCTAMLKVDVVVVHATPAARSAGTTSHRWWLNAMTRSVPANVIEAAVTRASADIAGAIRGVE